MSSKLSRIVQIDALIRAGRYLSVALFVRQCCRSPQADTPNPPAAIRNTKDVTRHWRIPGSDRVALSVTVFQYNPHKPAPKTARSAALACYVEANHHGGPDGTIRYTLRTARRY